MNFLINKTLRTRHFVSNTIIDASQGATVRGKSSMLVLLHIAYSEEPEFDYSATLKAEFAKGADNIWRFSRLTLLTDSSAVRSEEHTSELQSLMRISYAVLCLKKKTKTNT